VTAARRAGRSDVPAPSGTGLSGPLAGRGAVVTGASRGIGLATARALAAAGARVVMLARGREALDGRARDIGPHATAVVCDVTDSSAVAGAVEAIGRALGGTPDILVNSAGAFAPSPIDGIVPEEFARTIDVNLVAPFRFVHAFLPAMRQRGSGHVVSVGSIADRVTLPGNAAYAASKFGLRALHDVLRDELRGTGVRTTLVSPGPVDTPLWDPVAPESRAGFVARSAMLHADAVADAICWAVTRAPEVNVDELRLGRA
jgi:NADP-dependent 3-hydroxy acid dehydrogenase YdfG